VEWVVYKAEGTNLDRTVALKFLAPHLVSNSEVQKRFIREANSAPRCSFQTRYNTRTVEQPGARASKAIGSIHTHGRFVGLNVNASPPEQSSPTIFCHSTTTQESGTGNSELPSSSVYILRPGLDRSPSRWLIALLLLAISNCSTAVDSSSSGNPQNDTSEDQALVLAQAVLGETPEGKPRPLPARVVILERKGSTWISRFIEDPSSTAFHKAMAYKPAQGPGGLLTLGGVAAAVKFWTPGQAPETLWEADFGGKFSRMRDAEVGDIYGDGSATIAVVTHDQGVVATLRQKPEGGVQVEELDRQPDVIVHEIEIGDLDGDGVVEIYATPSAPNRMDGTPQHGQVVRYVPALGKAREEIVDLGERHAKEILVDDLDGDGRDELYISVEAISGGQVEIRCYRENSGAQPSVTAVAQLNDKLCRFLTTGDVDGDGNREMVAATNKSGLWLLRPGSGNWDVSLIDEDSSGFEHASILLDLDADGRDELYVASDRQSEVRRYDWSSEGWKKQTLLKYEKGLTGFTWNIMPVPRTFLPLD
jgi:hypothetical protein